MNNIEQLENDLWAAADNLRANSKLTSSEYCMPVLGVIFLRHATNRYDDAVRQIEANQAAGTMPKRPLVKGDFLKRRALQLPPEARYSTLLALPTGANLGEALIKAMDAIERDFEPLKGQLPRDYEKFASDLLGDLLRVFDSATLRTATGDVFGCIYEYFLMKFAMQGAQDNGEFFTPPSLVQVLVNVIEPDYGVVFDPACGSGGMFVQTSHFIEDRGLDTSHRVTFFGQEKTATTIRLAKMNLAVHGLEGDKRKATAVEDIRQLLERKLAEMLAQNPLRMDYYKKYSDIVADYNREKDRVTIEETFAKLVDLANSLDAEQRRATEEGLSEEEARAVRPAEETRNDEGRPRTGEASEPGLLESIRALIAPLERWTEKEQTQAEVEVFILDHLFKVLPTPPFTPEEKQTVAKRVYQHIWQQSANPQGTAAA